ncbi:MAG: hypothetical protein ACK568_08380, partial [Pseudanabaena sp.]
LEVMFRLKSKMVEFGFDPNALSLNKSKKASKDVFFVNMSNPSLGFSNNKIRFQRLVKFFKLPSFLIDCVDVSGA